MISLPQDEATENKLKIIWSMACNFANREYKNFDKMVDLNKDHMLTLADAPINVPLVLLDKATLRIDDLQNCAFAYPTSGSIVVKTSDGLVHSVDAYDVSYNGYRNFLEKVTLSGVLGVKVLKDNSLDTSKPVMVLPLDEMRVN